MSTPESPALGRAARPAFRQLPTALRFSLLGQARNRMAALLLLVFVPLWYLVMDAVAGEEPLRFRLHSTGRLLTVDAGELTLITAGLNALTMVCGFAVFDAIRRSLTFDRRLVFAGYRRPTLITAKVLAVILVTASVAVYASLVLLVYWRPSAAGWAAILAGFAVTALAYGALGLLLGVLVRNDLEGFFVIIMGGITDTFLQNPLGNPLANDPVLQYFPSFGPMQFAVGGAFDDTALWSRLGLGLLWAAGFATVGLLVFRVRVRRRG